MARWTGGARERLQDAALALYAEQGYAATTVSAIAARAGLTERTFFRHFPDKREVLFAQDDRLLAVLTEAVGSAPPEAGPLELARAALLALSAALTPHQEELRLRARVLAADGELRERDLSKQAKWTAALAAALESRGLTAPDAALTAATAAAVQRVALRDWLAEPGGADLPARVRTALLDLQRLLGPR